MPGLVPELRRPVPPPESEIAIPVVEEELAVGKREVETGARFHVRTFLREITGGGERQPAQPLGRD